MRAFNEYRNRHVNLSSVDIQFRIGPEDEFQDELAMFGGQTRVVTNKLLNRKRTRVPTKPREAREPAPPFSPGSSSSHTASSTPAPTSDGTPHSQSASSDEGTPLPQHVEEQVSSMHPALMEYLSLFPTEASISVMDVDSAPPPPHIACDALSSFALPSAFASKPAPSQSPSAFAAAAAEPMGSIDGLAGTLAHPHAGVGQLGMSGDAAQFLNVLPDGTASGAITEPALFFSENTVSPEMGLFASFAPGELGEQWNSLMRETGFFDQQGGTRICQDGMEGVPQVDIFPRF